MMRRLCALSLAAIGAIAILAAAPARAGGGPENVAVIVNADSWASRTIANEYISHRRIPASNVIFLEDVRNFDTITIDEFRDEILAPILKTLNDRGLARQIDCVVYSTDFPYAVDVTADVKAASIELPQVITPIASINGLTYLYPWVLAKNPQYYLGLQSNGYYRRTSRSRDNEPWTPAQQATYARAVQMLQEQKFDEAESLLRATLESHPQFDQALYNYACCLALRGELDDAVARLRDSVSAGWHDGAHIRQDSDLTALRDRDDFKAILADLEAVAAHVFDEIQPSRAFSARDAFLADGNITPNPNLGMRYLLSTMLAYTSGRGTSVVQAIAQIRRSVMADGHPPRGTIFFMKGTDVRSTTREWAFETAAARLRELGVDASVETGRLPENRRDIAGLMAGTASFDLNRSGSIILPGALCEHLTSYGGVMRADAGQTPLSRFLEAGAAGASGTVTEPYAIQNKFPDAMIQVHYARGCSLAEAFYQSVFGPYQLLIVGDALCQPWAKVPTVQVNGIRPGETVRGVITAKISLENEPPSAVDRYEVFIDGVFADTISPGASWTFDSAGVTDGFHELRFVAVRTGLIAERGRAIIPFFVKNEGRTVDLRRRGGGEVFPGEIVNLEVTARGAHAIRIEARGEVLDRKDGEQAAFAITPSNLGFGPIPFTAIAEYGDSEGVCASAPLDIELKVEAAAVPAEHRGIRLDRGMVLTPEGGERRFVTEMKPQSWLEDADVAKGQAYRVDGYVDVEADDLYQLQILTTQGVRVLLDGVVVYSGAGNRAGNRWHYAPLCMKKGVHRVSIEADGRGLPRMQVRFGSEGTDRVTGSVFYHMAE